MFEWHAFSSLTPTIRAVARDRDVVSIEAGDGALHRFRVTDVGTLTEHIAGDLGVARRALDDPPVLVAYRRASTEARAALRAAGASYVGQDGRVLLQAPGLFVERDDRLRPVDEPTGLVPTDEVARGRNPFATRGSRVARWLLLHPDREFSVSELARSVDLSPPAVSRIVRTLEDLALLAGAEVERDARRHQVVLREPRRLLETWAPLWERRRLRQRRWDIGARDAQEALSDLADAAAGQSARWRIGGLAGASLVARAVEPADVLVWVDAEDLAALAEALQPQSARTSEARRGTLRVVAAPDPWVLTIPSPVADSPVADPVQLWLDCVSEGERALEAAEAVAGTMGW